LYLGWLGHQNVGDDLMWDVFHEKFNSKVDTKKFKLIPSLKAVRDKIASDIKYLKQFDVIVLGGGSLLTPSFVDILYKAIHLNKKVEIFLWGCGIDWVERKDLNNIINKNNKLNQGKQKEFNRFPKGWFIQKLQPVINHSRFVGIRGSFTHEVLVNKGVDVNNVIVSGDPGLLLTSKNNNIERSKESNLVAINWGTTLNKIYGCNEEKLEEDMVKVIKELIKKGYDICIYPVWKKDVEVCQRLYSKLGENEKVHLITELYNQFEIIELLKKSKLSINFKLHPNVLSAVAGTPFIALGYRFKTFDFANSIGLDSFVVPTDHPYLTKSILDIIDQIENSDDLMSNINMYQQLYEKELDKVFTFFR
jgi:polysaccharide pyruvyl transferase WcaK-like protein